MLEPMPKLRIGLFDMGSQFGIVINRKAFTFKLPIPLRIDVIKYSLKHQGLWLSLKNKFFVKKNSELIKVE